MQSRLPSRLSVIFFDFGSTLIYSKDPWRPIYESADQAMLESLRLAGIEFDRSAFSGAFDTFLTTYYAERGAGVIERTTGSLLFELLQQQGFENVPASVVRNALDALYGVTQKNWYLEDDAIPTLTALLDSGYRLGMISNTSDDENVLQLLDCWDLRPYFELILTSAGCGIRKPDERIFQLGLNHFRVHPEQAAMVGDTLQADVLGAKEAGLFSIWITRRIEASDLDLAKTPQPAPVHPDAIVDRLTAIPPLLASLA
jgi:HAD superfamily hydrolase (TIGR01549 family)